MTGKDERMCKKRRDASARRAAAFMLSVLLGAAMLLAGCGNAGDAAESSAASVISPLAVSGKAVAQDVQKAQAEAERAAAEKEAEAAQQEEAAQQADALRSALSITEDYRSSFVHGEKGAAYQKYIVLHDTEGDGSAESVIDYWDGNGAGVAAHFVINKDGTIVQCVPLDKITHHAGFGDTGHNAAFGVEDESRDDKVGTVPIGSDHADYGMNSYSVGIEMVHTGGSGYYPEEQLEALDGLIAYIDAYYGFESTIIDHKTWRIGNSDTSPEFSQYLQNYQDHRTHD